MVNRPQMESKAEVQSRDSRPGTIWRSNVHFFFWKPEVALELEIGLAVVT